MTKKQIQLADTHMLIGRDRAGKTGTIDDYMERTNAKYNVVGAMSVVSPGYERPEGTYFPCIWEETPRGIITRSVLQKTDGTKEYGAVPNNPYNEANEITRNELEMASQKYSGTQFLHYPLLHLTRDTPEHLEKILSKNRVVKVHGIGSALGPEDVPSYVGELLHKHGNIVLPHTDYFQGEPENALQYLQKKNDPAKWMDFFEKYGIKGMFAHGARLCKDTLDKVKRKKDQFIVEVGPMINSLGPRIKTSTPDYIGKLIEMAGVDSLVFNTDYPFMEDNEDLERSLKSHLSSEDYQKVMYENAQRFLRFNDNKYLRGNLIK